MRDFGLACLRGIGQVFFQENAASGALFVLGIAMSSPWMALGGVVGSVLGVAVARLAAFEEAEVSAGLFGFNSCLVGIATFFFFEPGPVSFVLLVVGAIVAAPLTKLARKLPFPTYTSPFIVTTWVLRAIGPAVGATVVGAGPPAATHGLVMSALEATTHGVGQVMFQASVWTGLLFLAGIATCEVRHAAWVLVGSAAGALVATYHVVAGARALDPECLLERAVLENVTLGLYGYNACLAAVALFLWRRSVIPPLLGILLSVPLTESFPRLGLPALTAPFVLSTWIVLLLGRLEDGIRAEPGRPAST